MSNSTIFRKDLLETFQALEKQFSQALANAQQQEKQFDQHCKKFQRSVEQHLAQSMTKITETNPLYTAMANFKTILDATNQKWADDVESRDKGIRFREGFNDSLLVFVYGKVKSGKSSLGNYMAWGHTDPTSDLKKGIDSSLQPVYFSGEKSSISVDKGGDAEKEAESNREFRVGATEATSSIQGFSLPGLTWVDSPGLHSVKEENGKLAQEYVQHSDLILYTMKSDSPGRESDVKEIMDLYRADKKILLLITGSDTTEEDYDDEQDEIISTIIMKDKSTREKQQQYVREALEAIPELNGKTDNIDIVSFSARYAQLHHEQADEFLDSGMGQLFTHLQQIALADGVKLKQKAPLQGFANFIKQFEQDLDEYENALNEFHQPMQKLKRDIPILIDKELRQIQSQLDEIISQTFSSIGNRRAEKKQVDPNMIDGFVNDFTLKQFDKDIKKAVNQLKITQTELLIESQTKVLKQLLTQINADYQAVFSINSFFDIPEFKEEMRENKKPRVDKSNRGLFGVLGTAVGAAGGFAIAGPVGAYWGASIGGVLGSLAGKDTTIEYDTTSVKVGDNWADIVEQIHQQMRNMTTQQMNKFKEDILDIAVNSSDELIHHLHQDIQFFRKEIHQLEESIEKSLRA